MTVQSQWKELVENAILSEDFNEAWRGCGEAGLASEDAVKRVWDLVIKSDFHQANIDSICKDIMGDAATCWDKMDACDVDSRREKILQRYFRKLFQTLSTVASSYIIIGAMTGILLAANRQYECREFDPAAAD